jgi:hypothetical protein
MVAMRKMVERLKLTVNEEKTCLCQLPQERFDFLNYTIGRHYSGKTGKAYLGPRPARKSVQRMVQNVRQMTDRKMAWLDAEEVVRQLNRKLEGWANYFCLGSVSPAYRAIDRYTTRRLRRWLCRKHKGERQWRTKIPGPIPPGEAGPHMSMGATAQPAVGEGMKFCPSAGCGKSARPVRRTKEMPVGPSLCASSRLHSERQQIKDGRESIGGRHRSPQNQV